MNINLILSILGLILVIVGVLSLLGVIAAGGVAGGIVEILVGLLLIAFGSGRLGNLTGGGRNRV